MSSKEPVETGSGVVANRLPTGSHPGFSHLKSQPGVYRCRLRPELAKRDPRHADYKGILPLTGSKALILLWVHEDGTLGLRLEKITPKVPRTSHP
jgi:hypothetical protein